MPAITFDEQPFDRQHFLDLLDHLLAEYLLPWKLNPNAGYEMIEAFAAVGERVSTAINHAEKGMYTLFAEGGALGIAQVAFSRPTFAAGAFTLKAESLVKTSVGGRRYRLLNDIAFGATDLGPISASVVAIAFGYEWNTVGKLTRSSGEVIEGEIDTIDTLVTDPPFADSTLSVEQLAGTAWVGRAACLDAVGDERGISRQPGEDDDSYRLRLRQLPDTVSPGAVIRLCNHILGPLGLPFEHIETWQIDYQTCYDAPSPNPGTPSYDGGVPPANPAYHDNTCVYDDPRDPSPFRNRYLDELEDRGAFIVVVRRDLTVYDVGMAYDDPGMNPSNFHPPGGPRVGLGWRGTPVYDAPAGNPNVFAACYDGWDLMRDARYSSLYMSLQQIRAIGVAAIMDCIRP